MAYSLYASMDTTFLERLHEAHSCCTKCLTPRQIADFFDRLLGLMFPNFSSHPMKDKKSIEEEFRLLQGEFNMIQSVDDATRADITTKFFNKLPDIYNHLQGDIDAIYAGDPAARSREEVIRAYPGFYAIAAYRIAHQLLKLGVPSIPRCITEYAHSMTGIDIHPGASIGKRFFIDHGTGVVIGETTTIGDDVKIYQGVTLGALSVSKELSNVKRHPTIGDRVIIYSNATVLGGNTAVGNDSILGGNVWLTESVPEGSRVYYKAKVDKKKNSKDTLIIK